MVGFETSFGVEGVRMLKRREHVIPKSSSLDPPPFLLLLPPNFPISSNPWRLVNGYPVIYRYRITPEPFTSVSSLSVSGGCMLIRGGHYKNPDVILPVR